MCSVFADKQSILDQRFFFNTLREKSSKDRSMHQLLVGFRLHAKGFKTQRNSLQSQRVTRTCNSFRSNYDN